MSNMRVRAENAELRAELEHFRERNISLSTAVQNLSEQLSQVDIVTRRAGYQLIALNDQGQAVILPQLVSLNPPADDDVIEVLDLEPETTLTEND